MATTLQWLDLHFGRNGEMSQDYLMSFGVFKYCPTEKAKALQVFLPVFCIVTSQGVPIFEEVPSPSG